MEDVGASGGVEGAGWAGHGALGGEEAGSVGGREGRVRSVVVAVDVAEFVTGQAFAVAGEGDEVSDWVGHTD